MARVAINGLGRIGRATLKIILESEGLDLVAINDLVPPANLAYLLRYDTVYGKYNKQVCIEGSTLYIEDKAIAILNEKDPSQLPWADKGIDIVFECTGLFTAKADLQKHIDAGAKSVILSTTSKDEDVGTVVVGVNNIDKGQMISCASCTTNCITPVVEVMDRRVGVRKAMLTTIHAYTSSQEIVDSPNKKQFRRGRAGAANLVPASTGAALATTRALPQFKGKFDGSAIRSPVTDGSISDLTFVTSRPTSVEELRKIFIEESQSERYKGILGVTDDPIVSSDIIRDPRASVVDLEMIKVVDGDLVKIMSWYDNEWGYANQMVREAFVLSRNM